MIRAHVFDLQFGIRPDASGRHQYGHEETTFPNFRDKIHAGHYRHDQIGKGFIGIDTFKMIMNDPRMNDIPLILETPNDELWKEEIEMLYGMVRNDI